MTESKDSVSDINYIFEKEHGNLVTFNEQNSTNRLSIKQV